MSLAWSDISKISKERRNRKARERRLERRLYRITDRVTRLLQGQDCFFPVVGICKNEEKRFHSDKGPAIQWSDGEKAWFLEGIRFDYQTWKGLVDNTLTAREAIKLDNQTQRRFAIKRIGYAEMVKELGFKEVQTEGAYKILEGNLGDDNDGLARILQVKCPTTGYDYFIRIPPTRDFTIHQALAWSFGFDNWNGPAIYAPEKET